MSELEAAVDVVQLKKMPQVVRRYRTVKRHVLDRLGTYREIRPQRANDVEGEIGYLLRFYPESTELGQCIAEALRAEGISCSWRGRNAPPDWHVYSGMYPVLLQCGPTEDNCPFTCPLGTGGTQIEYAKGDCPVADDLFDRNISIRLDQWYTETDCAHIAQGINKVLSAYCTEDPDAAAWV
jgi:dTDP-4-amino-4,6-dideoxygalactose transaminase